MFSCIPNVYTRCPYLFYFSFYMELLPRLDLIPGLQVIFLVNDDLPT